MANQGHGYIGRQPSDSSVIVARQQYTPSGVTTDFTFSSGYTVGYIDLPQWCKIATTDYNATDGSTLSLTSAAQSGDVLELLHTRVLVLLMLSLVFSLLDQSYPAVLQI